MWTLESYLWKFYQKPNRKRRRLILDKETDWIWSVMLFFEDMTDFAILVFPFLLTSSTVLLLFQVMLNSDLFFLAITSTMFCLPCWDDCLPTKICGFGCIFFFLPTSSPFSRLTHGFQQPLAFHVLVRRW